MKDSEMAVVALARQVAQAAPKKQGTYVSNAGVPWRLIHGLRDAFARLDREAEERTGR